MRNRLERKCLKLKRTRFGTMLAIVRALGCFGSSQMQSETPVFDSMTTKLIACVVIVALLLLGGIGLILPIFPGLLFIVIAAAVAARLSPELNSTLRRNPTLAGYLDKIDGVMALPTFGQK